MKTKTQKLSKEEFELAQKLLQLPLPEGEKRNVYICPEKDCRKIQAHDFIPYGLGRGVWRNMCHCNAVSGNWIFDAVKLFSKP